MKMALDISTSDEDYLLKAKELELEAYISAFERRLDKIHNLFKKNNEDNHYIINQINQIKADLSEIKGLGLLEYIKGEK